MERVLASYQCGLGLIPDLCVTCGLRLLLVLILALRVFSLNLLPPKKLTLQIPIRSGNSGQKEPLSGMSIFKFQFHFSILISSKPM